jgi:hypothetical protein
VLVAGLPEDTAALLEDHKDSRTDSEVGFDESGARIHNSVEVVVVAGVHNSLVVEGRMRLVARQGRRESVLREGRVRLLLLGRGLRILVIDD